MLLPLMLAAITFDDIAPLLERKCLACHSPGQIAPQNFTSYAQLRPWAKALRSAILQHKMPPWFAVEGDFRNDGSLSPNERALLVQWVDQGAKPGSRTQLKPPAETTPPTPDLTIQPPTDIAIPATGELPYQYLILPNLFPRAQWLQHITVLPSDRRAVHHLVVYARSPGAAWLKEKPVNRFFTVAAAEGATQADILAVYTPGSGSVSYPDDMAKHISAGADVVLQIHYNPTGKPTRDRPKIHLTFARQQPRYNVLTLQLNKSSLHIPAMEKAHRETVSGTMPAAALLLGFLPHMHLRGRAFTYRLIESGGRVRTLLRVDPYHFYWQRQYWLKTPLPLVAGARLQAEAVYDNSAANPLNPDPSADVSYCEASTCEMLVGFFEVAVDATLDKSTFFQLRGR